MAIPNGVGSLEPRGYCIFLPGAHYLTINSPYGGNNGADSSQLLGAPGRVMANVLNLHPVEVLAIKEQPNLPNKAQQRFWVKWLDKCKHVNLPNYVLISAHARELVEADGLHTKSWRRRFQVWGYEAHYWFLRAHDHGGVVCQDRCMLVLRRQDDSVPKVRLPEIIATEGGPRTARNMLKPMDIPKAAWIREDWTSREDYPEWVTSAARPCVIVGELVALKTPIFSPDGCLPDSVGSLLSTDRGIRRLLPEELAKAKAFPMPGCLRTSYRLGR